MRKKQSTRLVHEGDLAAEVQVALLEDEGGWSPYLSLDDARKLDELREALERGDIKTAQRHARVYRLMLVTA